MKKILFFVLCQFLFLSVSFADTSPSVTREEAIEIAENYLIDQNISVDQFDENVRANYVNGNWMIIFRGKPDAETGTIIIGSHFQVKVSSEGEVISYLPGH